MKVVLDQAHMQMIAMFESLTRASIKDCITDDEQVIFIVNPGDIGKAVGKGGANVRTFEKKLKKKVKIVEYNQDIIQFVKNVISPLEVSQADLEEDVVVLTAKDLKTRGLLIGRSASNLRQFEAIVKRYFPIKEIKVT